MTAAASLTMRPATELARMVTARETSARELIEATLAQIERVNPALNAIVTLNEHALDDAGAIDARLARGEAVGPLAGLPVGIKDVTQVGGLRTTFGSPLYSDHVPDEDALVVQRLRAAGAIIVGKTNCPEFAAGGNTFNAVFGRTRNPWDLTRSAGGSTGGGAAALATGMIALAEGTDLGGSLRIPASFCGVVGLRPSPGLVPTHPFDYVWDTLQVTGPMARTAQDVALMLQAICGASDFAPLAQPTAGRDFVGAVRRGLPRATRAIYVADIAGIGVDPAIGTVCREAAFCLTNADFLPSEESLDLTFARSAFLALRGYWFLAMLYSRLALLEQFGANVANNVRSGLAADPKDLGAAEEVRGRLWHIFRDLFKRTDYLLTPCMAVPPFPVEQNYPDSIAGKPMSTYVDWIAPTFVLSLTGLPVASVPCGLDPNGYPVGLQVVGRPRDEEGVLAVAALIQELVPLRPPPLATADL
ncbi:MAG TPA: amidase family protein [Gemmatimonadaceae bacterium]